MMDSPADEIADLRETDLYHILEAADEPLTVTEIQERGCERPQSTIRARLDRLRKAGLLTKRPDVREPVRNVYELDG